MNEIPRKELAAALGLSTRQIANLEKEGLPHRVDGRRKFYPVPDAVMWYFGRGEKDPRIRKLQAEAELVELQLAREKRELVEVEEVFEVVMGGISRLRAHLVGLPGRIAPLLPMPTPDAVAVLDPAVREYMDELTTIEWFRDED